MSKMGRYMKAYPVELLRRFPAWAESARESSERPYLYLQENYTVTEGIFLDEGVVFDTVTPAWTEFCQHTLEFEMPDWDRSGVGDGTP
jgi:hypothetical protein